MYIYIYIYNMLAVERRKARRGWTTGGWGVKVGVRVNPLYMYIYTKRKKARRGWRRNGG